MGAYLSSPVKEKESEAGELGTMKFGVSAMQGWRRTMEDAHLAEHVGDANAAIFGVFDGHGGPEVAKFCAKYMPAQFTSLDAYKSGDVKTALVDVFHRMDELLNSKEFAEEVKDLRGMGEDEDPMGDPGGGDPLRMFIKRVTEGRAWPANGEEGETPVDDMNVNDIQAGCTAVVALVHQGKMHVANAGDSRAIVSRTGMAEALSIDHKPSQETEKSRIEAAGGFISDIGGVCRVNGNLNLSRAIGDLRYKTNKAVTRDRQIITAEPDIQTIEITPDLEFAVLACDGVWDVMSNQQVVDFVRARLAGVGPVNADHVKRVAEELLDACLAVDPKETRGVGCDNMTCVIVTFKDKF